MVRRVWVGTTHVPDSGIVMGGGGSVRLGGLWRRVFALRSRGLCGFMTMEGCVLCIITGCKVVKLREDKVCHDTAP